MNEPLRIKCAGVEYNGDFICIQAYSGYNFLMADPTTTEYLLIADTPNEVLGKAVLDALKQSRFLSYKEECALEKVAEKYYIAWIKKMVNRYGYKNKTELFLNMKSCMIERHENVLTIRPSHHEDLEIWRCEGIIEEANLKIPVSSSAAKVGAALRIAFSRCTG